jgi:hypothetical protein
MDIEARRGELAKVDIHPIWIHPKITTKPLKIA